MTRASLRRRINTSKAQRHKFQYSVRNSGVPQLVKDTSDSKPCDIMDDDGFVLTLTKRERRLLKSAQFPSETSEDPMKVVECPDEPENTPPKQVAYAPDDGFEVSSTISKSSVRRQLKGPHRGGISRPSCSKRSTEVVRRALFRAQLHLQHTVPTSNARVDKVFPSQSAIPTKSDPDVLSKHASIISQWASRASSTSSTPKRKRKKKNKLEPEADSSSTKNPPPTDPYKVHRHSVVEAVNCLRTMLPKF
ncbi:unnamed protein product [Dicrocoelium dendriticum]|nr:unnamed protein product [Dicrocoelium dendriticum]